MAESLPEKQDLEGQNQAETSKAIRFDEESDQVALRSQGQAFKRRNSTTSQNIIAYRTLSITVSEHEAKRSNVTSKKRGLFGKKTEAVEGNAYILINIHLLFPCINITLNYIRDRFHKFPQAFCG
jgi:hypothetical protein